MSDVQIINNMIHADYDRYYEEDFNQRISAEEAYDACIEFCDTELNEAFKTIREVILQAKREYGYSITEILNDMVIPSIESEVLR